MEYEKISNKGALCSRQGGQRAEVAIMCEVRQGSRAWTMTRLEDLSQSGFRLTWLPRYSQHLPMRIRIPGLQLLTANIRWHDGKSAGCAFEEPLHVAVFEHIVRSCEAARK
jgi:hypothetical protein